MKVYLDNNVLVDIESGKYQLEIFCALPDVEYYYSDAHLNELLEAKGNPKVSQKGRLDLIAKLCGKHYICSGVTKAPEFLEKDCREMYGFVDIPLRAYINKAVSVGIDPLDVVREKLGFDCKVFNNESPKRVLQIIDERMVEKLNVGLLDYLYRTDAYGRALYGTLLNIIDTANYWGDVKTEHSEVAKLSDASHAYSAQICDMLVTNDKRMRAKVKAIYAFLGVATQVLSVTEFLSTVTR